MLGLFIWGAISFVQTPKKYNPTIVAPAFKVTVQVPGASRNEILEQVTKPLENVITDIPGVEDIYSMTAHGGMVQIYVNFFVGEDLDSAKVSLNDRLQSDANLAPQGIIGPTIESLDPEDVPVLTIALTSKDLSPIELRRWGFEVKDHLSQVNGTSRLNVIGGRKRELRVELIPEKLSHYVVSVQEISETLKNSNVYLPSGPIKGEKINYNIHTNAWVSSAEEVEEIVIKNNDAIQIRLKDVAKVYESEEEVNSLVRHQKVDEKLGHVVLLSLAKKKGTNISDITDEVISKLDQIKKQLLPSNIKAEVLVNDGNTARDEINSLMSNLLTAIVIVIAVLFLFLNAKASILVAVSIPLTLSMVFGAAYLAGHDINRITLFALILSLGLLVDNATVVIENIIRQVGEEKKVTTETFAQAVSEVGPGLFMATITTILAFIPMKFISGMMGPYMGPIPFFVPTALVFALIISYTINPWMASVIIKKEEGMTSHNEAKISKWQQLGTTFILKYRQFIRHLMQDSKKGKLLLSGIFIILLLVSTFPAIKWVKFRMLPKANVDQFFVYLDLPAGTSLWETQKSVELIEKKIQENKNVTMVQSYVGTPPILDFNGLFKNVSNRMLPNQATLRVGLLPDDQRDITSEHIVLNMRKELNKVVSSIKGVKLKLIEDPPGPPVQSTMLVRVQSNHEGLMTKEALALMPKLKKIEETVDHDLTLPSPSEDVYVSVDHFACAKARVSPGQVVDTLNAFYSGRITGVYHRKQLREQEFITLRISPDKRKDVNLLKELLIPNMRGINIPLSRLTKIEKAAAIPHLMRENHKNTIYLTSEMGNRSITYAGIDLLMDLYKYRLSDQFKGESAELLSWNLFGMTYKYPNGPTVKISLGGEWELTLEVFRDLIIAMIVAVMAIYLVLVGQFKSFTDALLIMSTIPLSVIGIMPGFAIMGALTGEYFTATSMIGVIALAGIAVNNAIIMLEYINSMKGKASNIIDALTEAAATRLRPIALTTITTVLGSLTIISDPVWSGLAWAIVWGLAVSSTLILIVFPLLYHMVHFKKWVN